MAARWPTIQKKLLRNKSGKLKSEGTLAAVCLLRNHFHPLIWRLDCKCKTLINLTQLSSYIHHRWWDLGLLLKSRWQSPGSEQTSYRGGETHNCQTASGKHLKQLCESRRPSSLLILALVCVHTPTHTQTHTLVQMRTAVKPALLIWNALSLQARRRMKFNWPHSGWNLCIGVCLCA